MKVLAIIFSGLVLQAFASFFEDLRGAVSSVESSFGKLLNDVIYDVKETIDCTLMAVEQVLASGVFRDPSEYDARCRGATEVVEQPPPEVVAVATDPSPPPVQETQYLGTPLTKKELIQVDSSILNVDEVLCDVLKKDDTHAKLESVKLALKNETVRLAEISKLLKKQLVELSVEVKEKFKLIELQTSEPSVESIWNDIKLLHEIEHRHKNTDEAKKISRVLDQILSILDANEEDRSAADDYKIQEIMRKLSRQTKGGDSDIWEDLKNHPKDFRDYAKKIFDENRPTLPPDDVTEKPYSEEKKSVREDAGNKDDSDSEEKKSVPEDAGNKDESDSEKKKSVSEDAGNKDESDSQEKKSVPEDAGNKDESDSEEKKSVPEDAGNKDESDSQERKSVPEDAGNKDESDSEKKKSVPEDAGKKDESDKKDNQTEEPTDVTTVKPKRKKRKPKIKITTTSEKSLTIEELEAQYGSLFDVTPDIDNIENKKALESAISIIEDSKLNDEVMNSIADFESSKYARNVFDDPELLRDFKI